MLIRNMGQFCITTQPQWKQLICTVFLSCVLADCWLDAIADPVSFIAFVIGAVEALLIVSVMVSSCLHYQFTDDYLVVCFLWIRLRRIRWSRITHAVYVHAWVDPKTKYQRIKNHGPVTGQIIYVTIDGCLRWYPLLTQRWLHHLCHPFRSFTIWLPYNRKYFFIETFQRYYPDLEIQPLDEWKKFYDKV